MKHFKYLALAALLSAFGSCKDDAVEVQETPFSFSVPDSLIFEHSGSKNLSVSVTSAAGKLLSAAVGSIPAGFNVVNAALEVEANSSRDFTFEMNQNSVNPGVYNVPLTVSIFNENSTPKTKQIYLVYRPQCEYNFRNFTYGRITYVINGSPINKVVSCAYSTEGKLLVSNLTSYDIILDVNCASNAVTMQPVIHLGNYMTASGTIVNDEIQLNIYNEGVLDATAIVRAF